MEVQWKCCHIYRTAKHVADSSIYKNLWKDALKASNLGPGKFMRSIRFPFPKLLLLQNWTILKSKCPCTTAATKLTAKKHYKLVSPLGNTCQEIQIFHNPYSQFFTTFRDKYSMTIIKAFTLQRQSCAKQNSLKDIRTYIISWELSLYMLWSKHCKFSHQ